MGRMSRQKGKRGEREAAAELGLLLGCTARRGVQYHGGPDSPDVVLEGVNIHVECKRTESLNVYAAVEQAREDAGQKVPVVWHRRNGKPSVVIVKTADLMALAKEITTASLQNATAAKCSDAKCNTHMGGVGGTGPSAKVCRKRDRRSALKTQCFRPADGRPNDKNE